MSSNDSVIDYYKKASLKKENEIFESVEDSKIADVIDSDTILNSLPVVEQEPFESFVSTLAETLKSQKKLKKEELVLTKNDTSEEVKVVSAEEPNTNQQEPFESFITSLASVIKKEKNKKNEVKDLIEDTEPLFKPSSNNVKEKTIIDDYAQELAKNSKNDPVIDEEEKKIQNIVSQKINEQINKTRQVYPNIGMQSSGGGTNAVQYANGGTMNGDLNVLGKYLSGGIDLTEIFGGGSSGISDKLISGLQSLILSSDGSLFFNTQDNNAVLATGAGYRWVFNNNGVVSGPSNTFTVENFDTNGVLLSGGIGLSDLFLPKQELIVDGGSY